MLREAFYCKNTVSDLLLVTYILWETCGGPFLCRASLSPACPVSRGSAFLGQDFALVLAGFQKVLVCSLLQPVRVPLDNSPSLGVYQQIPQFYCHCRFAAAAPHHLLLVTNKGVKQSRSQDGPNSHFLLNMVIQPVLYPSGCLCSSNIISGMKHMISDVM